MSYYAHAYDDPPGCTDCGRATTLIDPRDRAPADLKARVADLEADNVTLRDEPDARLVGCVSPELRLEYLISWVL